VQQLGDDEVRDLIVHRRSEEDDSLVEQTAVYVEGALSARGLLDNHRYEWAHRPRSFASSAGILPTVATALACLARVPD
jgi:hypothetical protein